jgi:hypothetical protein
MKSHNMFVDRLKKSATDYPKKARKCGDITVTAHMKRQEDDLKVQMTLEAIAEITKAFWFPKQVHVYCDDDPRSVGYIPQKMNTIYEAHIGLGNSSINYVKAAAGADAQAYSDYKYGGPWDGGSWRLFADTAELYTAIGGPFPDTFSVLAEMKAGIGSLGKPSM